MKKDPNGVLLEADSDLKEIINFLSPNDTKNLFYYIFEFFS